MELGSALWSNEGKKRAFLYKPARTSSVRIPSDGYRTKEAAITKAPNVQRYQTFCKQTSLLILDGIIRYIKYLWSHLSFHHNLIIFISLFIVIVQRTLHWISEFMFNSIGYSSYFFPLISQRIKRKFIIFLIHMYALLISSNCTLHIFATLCTY